MQTCACSTQATAGPAENAEDTYSMYGADAHTVACDHTPSHSTHSCDGAFGVIPQDIWGVVTNRYDHWKPLRNYRRPKKPRNGISTSQTRAAPLSYRQLTARTATCKLIFTTLADLPILSKFCTLRKDNIKNSRARAHCKAQFTVRG